MNFIRMGDVHMDEFEFQPGYKHFDGSVLSLPLLKTNILERAHFYDVVEKASLNAYVTYIVEIICVMRSGHTVKMGGTCTPYEYQHLYAMAKAMEKNSPIY